MNTVQSADGTTIAFTRAGQGPPLILVDGALCSRSFGPMPKLAAELAPRFTVYTYDRRGRGASGDTPPYAPDREVDDLERRSRDGQGPRPWPTKSRISAPRLREPFSRGAVVW